MRSTTFAACWLAAAPAAVFGQSFSISTPAGPVKVEVSHVAPAGALVAPDAPEPDAFRPPSVFSAPLPSGSGARALGLAGSFTALADDATAASWNPAGLIQLQRPEASAVYRFSKDEADHFSDDPSFDVGGNEYSSDNLNYVSAVYPFFVPALERNFVASLNLQEAYDFTQEFTARPSQTDRSTAKDHGAKTFKGTEIDHIDDGIADITVRSRLTTRVESTFDQVLSSELLSDLDFRQEGVISAFTPALAAEITPKLSLGVAFNWYMIDPLQNGPIRSVTRANYSGKTTSDVTSRSRRTTTGSYDYEGIAHLPPGGIVPVPIDVPVAGSGTIPAFSDSSTGRSRSPVFVEGTYEEVNEYDDLEGFNATLGALWTVNKLVTLGLTVDLPWTAEARQKQTVRNKRTTFDASHTRVLDAIDTTDTIEKDIEFDFPLYWAAGALFRWTPSFFTTLDLSETMWSDFAYQAEGAGKINPLDGSPHGENPLDDCWAARAGAEYLIVLKENEIPLRCGVAWEERPALGQPDDYYSVSLGTGLAFGKENARNIIDIAWIYTWADDIQGIVPENPSLKSDVTEQQLYVSYIRHF